MSSRRANRNRHKPGRPANEPPKPQPKTYPRKPADCEHERGQWLVATEVLNAWASPSNDMTPESPDRYLVSHVLAVRGVRCNDCGQPFRFKNLTVGGDPLTGPIAGPGALELATAIEPDLRIITPDQARGKILTRH